jgi:hypothetical protein
VIHIINYDKNGLFQCESNTPHPVFEGEPFIRWNGKRICLKCVHEYIDDITEYASFQDSDYAQQLDSEIQERIDNNGKR